MELDFDKYENGYNEETHFKCASCGEILEIEEKADEGYFNQNNDCCYDCVQYMQDEQELQRQESHMSRFI